jgi:hypothetical protein
MRLLLLVVVLLGVLGLRSQCRQLEGGCCRGAPDWHNRWVVRVWMLLVLVLLVWCFVVPCVNM